MSARPKEELVFGVNTCSVILQRGSSRARSLSVIDSRNDERVGQLIALAMDRGLPVERYDAALFEREVQSYCDQHGMTLPRNHQGVALRCAPLQSQDENFLKSLVALHDGSLLLLVLDGVTDPHNLGACLRSADAVAAQAVIVPADNAAGLTPVVRKVASGAAETTPLVVVKNLARCIENLQKAGVWVMGASAEAPQSLYDLDLQGNTALVLGAEGSGLRRLTRERCDALFAIPMQGSVESLNVSVAAGIGLFEARRQRLAK